VRPATPARGRTHHSAAQRPTLRPANGIEHARHPRESPATGPSQARPDTTEVPAIDAATTICQSAPLIADAIAERGHAGGLRFSYSANGVVIAGFALPAVLGPLRTAFTAAGWTHDTPLDRGPKVGPQETLDTTPPALAAAAPYSVVFRPPWPRTTTGRARRSSNDGPGRTAATAAQPLEAKL